jgi:hypothetical protein
MPRKKEYPTMIPCSKKVRDAVNAEAKKRGMFAYEVVEEIYKKARR